VGLKFFEGALIRGESRKNGAQMATELQTGSERRSPALNQAVGLGTNILAGVVLCSLAGYWMDRRWGGGYGWTLGGMLMGMAYSAYEVWKTVAALNAEEARRRQEARKCGSGSS
jgi:F0F1-type ATP synthase assembly protein I